MYYYGVGYQIVEVMVMGIEQVVDQVQCIVEWQYVYGVQQVVGDGGYLVYWCVIVCEYVQVQCVFVEGMVLLCFVDDWVGLVDQEYQYQVEFGVE